MSVARMTRVSTADRLLALEQRLDGHDKRADAHEKLVKPMVGQVSELYEAWTGLRRFLSVINRLSVKISAAVAGLLGAGAAVLTIIEKLRILFGH